MAFRPRSPVIDPTTGPEEYLDGLRAVGLEVVEVRERLVYDATHLEGLIQSDLASADPHCRVRLDAPYFLQETLCGIAESLTGKIWSAMFYARKPGT